MSSDRGGRGGRGGRGRGGFDGPPRGGGGRGFDGPPRGGGGRGFDGPPRGGGGGRGGGGFAPRGGRGGPVGVFGNGTFPKPDPEVTKLEDASMKLDLASQMSGLSVQDRLPRRPAYGTLGRKIVLWANYFQLAPIDQKSGPLYRYSVGFQKAEGIPKPKKKRLIELLLGQAPFQGVTSASDGAQLIVTTEKVKLNGRQTFDIIWYPKGGEPFPPPTAGEPAGRASARKRNTQKLLVEELGTVSIPDLLKDISFEGGGGYYPLRLETIQALNILLSQSPSSDPMITAAGGGKYYPFNGHEEFVHRDLGQGLTALRGYFSSVRTGVRRIIVNINVATGAFFKPGPLMQLMLEFNRGGPPSNTEEYRKIAAFVRKLRIRTEYLIELDAKGKPKSGKNGPIRKEKIHTIAGLSGQGRNATNTKFDYTDAAGVTRNVTVANYFLNVHKMPLKNPAWPLVNTGTAADPAWIPAELCVVLPGQQAKRLLLPDQTRQMIEFAARSPDQNAMSIVGSGLSVVGINPISEGLNTSLKKFGIKVSASMLTVDGRILDPPTLRYHKNSNSVRPREGKWNLADGIKPRPFFQGSVIQKLSCLVIDGDRPTIYGGAAQLTAFLKDFRETLGRYGVNIQQAVEHKSVTVSSFDLQQRNPDKISSMIQTALQSMGPKPQFLFVLLPSDNAFLYDCIKHLCDVRLGIPTVCNIGQKFSKDRGQAQYFANVALKFNLKKGGINHYVSTDEMKPLDAQTIVFGIDVTHPSPGSSDSAPSIAGIVASVDTKFTQYPASVRTQTGRKEMVSDLEEMIVERLKLWSARNKGLPTKVIVYRDGVSEGQYAIVLNEEYPCFVKAFNKLYGAAAKHPKISIIVVGKRHHTRFYPTTVPDADGRTGNCQPGTVVDRGVTGERLFDFFLVAHQGLQGTSKPAHYVVIKDDNKLGADQLQKLTHNLCYTFGRATRSVSVCPPAYYADILCERGRSYLHNVLKGDGSAAFGPNSWQRDVHGNLKDTMFYL